MASQGKSIENRVRNQMRQLARENPQEWAAKSYTERLHEAASEAAKEMKEEFARKRQIIEKTIAVHDRIENFLADQPHKKSGDTLRAASRLLDFDTTGGGYASVHSWSNAVKAEAYSRLIPAWKAVPGHFFSLFEDAKGVSDLWKEIHGEESGNPMAKAGAKAWKETTEEMRQRFNDGGGTTGKLENWAVPQHHSSARVIGAGIEKWVGDILPKLDMTKYVNEDGSKMSGDQMHSFLAHAYDSIITDGHNSQEPGSVSGTGVIANRNAARRQIFFKDSDAHADYNAQYGEKSLFNLMSGHVAQLSNDIALVERLGPNSAATFKFFNDRARLDELRQAVNERQKNNVLAESKKNEALYDAVSGKNEVVNQTIANRFQAFRNWMTASKLGKVAITALGDEAGMMSTSFANKVPYSQVLLNELKSIPAGKNREFAEHSALGLDAMMGHLNRFAQEEFGASFSGKMASTVMRLSGAERMWAARRQGMGVTLMSSIGKLTRKIDSVSKLSQADHGVLANKGVTDKQWEVWRRAEPENWGGSSTVLTPKSIWAIPDEQLRDLGDPRALKREATTMLLSHTLEEAGMGAMDTGPRQRAAMNMGTTRGTWGGEIWRSMNLFRSFGISMMSKHWARATSIPGLTGKIGYLAPLFLYGTALAAAGNQIRNLLSGNDPDNMTGKDSWRFWGSAVMRGGGFGFFGDFLYDETTGGDTSLAAALGGPAMTTMEDLWNVTGGAGIKHLQGKRVDEGAKLVRFAKGNLPLLNMWYTQQAANHLLWNHAQEAASPGYMGRMMARQQGTFGKSYYWRPDESLPHAGPDLAKAIGGSNPNQSFAGN